MSDFKVTATIADDFLSTREGESKLGEKVSFWWDQAGVSLRDQLKSLHASGIRYALLGIEEDIGARANHGRGGCVDTWSAFLSSFLNSQTNQFIEPARICIFGTIDLEDIKSKDKGDYSSPEELRKLCEKIDKRVEPIISTLVSSGFEPVVIGGGHNNAFPILSGTAKGLSTRYGHATKLNCLNADAHADYRALEGRHSGNPFSYAANTGTLENYSIIGLQESYNSQEMLQRLAQDKVCYSTFEEIKIRHTLSLEEAMVASINQLLPNGLPCGVEIDLDCIADMPTSAESPFGFTIEEVAQVVSQSANLLPTCYLHLCEGAPKWSKNGDRIVGRTLSLLALSYLRARDNVRGGVN